VRKAIRNLAAARDSGKGEEKIEKLEAIFQALKDLDLDGFVQRTISVVPNLDPILLPSECRMADALPEALRTAESLVLRTTIVQEQFKALSALFNPIESLKSSPPTASKKLNAAKEKSQANEENSVNADENSVCSQTDDHSSARGSLSCGDDSDASEDRTDSKKISKMQRNSRNSRKEDEQSESEPEDVSALIGERPSKNRPGQRTRRKMILQKYGRNALVFQKERDRKSQQATEAAQETLHPSWAAKQRLKAAMSAAIKGGVASSPKKVRLDDERMSSRKVSSSSEKSARQSASGESRYFITQGPSMFHWAGSKRF
jgi:hypothetical protein